MNTKAHWATQFELDSGIKFKIESNKVFVLKVGIDKDSARWKWYLAKGREARKLRSL